MKRLNSIDIVRGVVMMIMALDHVRDLIHVDAIAQSPTNLATTTPILFFTRWITHLCAPTFVFLAGTSVYLSLKNSENISETRMFLIKRGLWLIILEFTLVNFALWFDFGAHILIFEVIAAIGFGFIILGLLLNLSPKTLGIIGLIIIFGQHLIPLIPFGEGSVIKMILTPLFGSTAYPIAANMTLVMGYPPIPWLAIMLLGFASGKFFEMDEDRRKRLFLKIGFGALGLFALLRFLNFYGEPVLWTWQKDAVYTTLSFFNVTKYPPSLQFCLVILGCTFLMLAFAEKAKNKFTEIAMVYGKVPLFYFLIHLYLIHLILLAVLFLQGFYFSQLDFASGTFGRPKDAPSGLDLWAIYLIWIGVVAFLYFPCRWYGAYKAQHPEKGWLRYL
jgi:uncharacterized membrane protein